MRIDLAAVPRVPKTALVAATVAGGAGVAALTPSILPRTETDQRLLAIGGGVLGAAAGGVALGAMRLARAPMGAAYQPVRTALTAATVIGAGTAVATHWDPRTVPAPVEPTYHPGGKPVVETLEEHRAQPAKPGTSDAGREIMPERGLRFLDTIMTGLKSTPVRAYASLDHGATPQERIDFAVDRMRELGAFEKSRIVVAQPTGTGFVDQMPIQAAEVLADGDIATVAVQYGDSPSLSLDSMLHRDEAAEQYRMLLRAVRDEIASMPAAERPDVYVYGYSLGSWGTQDAVATEDTSRFDELGVKRALWIGTPGPSKWHERMPEGSATKVEDLEDLKQMTSEDMPDSVRALGYDNANDPVAKLDPSTIWRKPDWMRGEDQVSEGVWVPGITYLQTLIDSKIAIEASQPGVYRDTAHEYRLADAKAVQLAFDLPDTDTARLQQVTDRLERLEQEYFATHP